MTQNHPLKSFKPYRTDDYEKFLRPLLFKLDPESAHNLIYSAAPYLQTIAPQLASRFYFEDNSLVTDFAGQQYKNPIGLAAGFDKNARLAHLLDVLGLGLIEVGSVTHRASIGNPKPRLFRLPQDEAVINRLGLNGDGAAVVAPRLAGIKCRTPLAVNIAKTNDPSIIGDLAVKDLVGSFLAVRNLDVSYLTLNASCPNTHDGITRETGELDDALAEMQSANSNNIPLFIKLSPDSSDQLLGSILELGRSHKIAGYVCGNTTVSRPSLKTSAITVENIKNGGLSGKPLQPLAYSLCSRVMRLKEVNQSVIACGGIASGEDVFRFLQLGACAVQVYTALVYRGPGVIRAMKEELSMILKSRGTTVLELVNSAQVQPIGL